MNRLYLISQSVNDNYDTFDSAVVCATSELAACYIHPRKMENDHEWWLDDNRYGFISTWARPNEVQAQYIGEAAEGIKPGTVLCSSFNAG